jgi:N-dimethylarginine dimethylaminohydrolase
MDVAKRQWKRLLDQFRDLGIHVFVVPSVKDQPGMVFPANAGVIIDRDAKKPFSQKIFLMSCLTPGRSGEEVYYQKFFERLGFQIQKAPYRFEGEADFFPAGSFSIFTHGKIIRQRFKLYSGFPPYKRQYGFRTDEKMLEILSGLAHLKIILSLELIDERFYHGDTVCCSFGLNRNFLLVYLPALSLKSQELLRDSFRDFLIPLTSEDAFRFAANSFFINTGDGPFLFMPSGISQGLKDQVKERGVIPVEVDVSEFFEKGGGSIKCMLLDLGPVV